MIDASHKARYVIVQEHVATTSITRMPRGAPMTGAVSVRAPADLVKELYTALAAAGVAVDAPQSAESSDAVNAPIGTRQARTLLMLLTLAFNTGSAGIAFGEKLIELKHKLGDIQTIELVHPVTGSLIETIDKNTTDQAIRDVLAGLE